MPEGPEVKVVVDKLQFLQNYYLSAIIWDNKSKYRNGLDNFDLISAYLPIRIDAIHCKGKQIFFKLVGSNSTINTKISDTGIPDISDGLIYFYLNITLGMDGKLLHEAGNYSNMIFNLCQDYTLTSNQTIITFDMRTLYYDDSRHFGNIFILTEEQYVHKILTIGPDLLVDDIDELMWLTKARNTRIKKKQICDYLMEQKYFSGIGNYLKSEILYVARIKPDRTMVDITDDEFITILHVAQQIIQRSYSSNGLTIQSFIDPTGETGKYQRLVYDKKIDQNGYIIVRSKFTDKRTTYWVPELQH